MYIDILLVITFLKPIYFMLFLVVTIFYMYIRNSASGYVYTNKTSTYLFKGYVLEWIHVSVS